MRRFLPILLLAAACGGANKGGPAWPKSADYVPDYTSEDEQWKEDGGESIDPHASKDTPVEDSGDDDAAFAEWADYDFTPDTDVVIDTAPPPESSSPDDAPPPPPDLGTP